MRGFLQTLHKCLLWLKDELIQFWRSNVKGIFQEYYSEIFIKFVTDLHLDWRLNWLDFRGQRSLECHILWTQYLKNPVGEFPYIWPNIYIHLRMNRLDFGGPRSKVNVTFHSVKQYLKNTLREFIQMYNCHPLVLVSHA